MRLWLHPWEREFVIEITYLWSTAGEKGAGKGLTAGVEGPQAEMTVRGCAQLCRRQLTSVKRQATVAQMRIRDFVHKGLMRLYEDDSAKGVPAGTADKLRKMLAFLDGMDDAEELRALPIWKAHTLTGDRKGT